MAAYENSTVKCDVGSIIVVSYCEAEHRVLKAFDGMKSIIMSTDIVYVLCFQSTAIETFIPSTLVLPSDFSAFVRPSEILTLLFHSKTNFQFHLR